MSKMRQRDAEKVEAIKALRVLLRPGTTVFTVLRHVSASGMSRRIDLYVIRKNEPRFLSGWVGQALDLKRSEKGGLVVGGCGMDMGFHLVYELSRVLFPRGYVPARAGAKFGRNGTPATKRDPDGGYALNHRWL